jgi:hypothetical protein
MRGNSRASPATSRELSHALIDPHDPFQLELDGDHHLQVAIAVRTNAASNVEENSAAIAVAVPLGNKGDTVMAKLRVRSGSDFESVPVPEHDEHGHDLDHAPQRAPGPITCYEKYNRNSAGLSLFSAYCVNGFVSYWVVNGLFSILACNAVASFLCINSVASLFSINSVCCIGCVNGWFQICFGASAASSDTGYDTSGASDSCDVVPCPQVS